MSGPNLHTSKEGFEPPSKKEATYYTVEQVAAIIGKSTRTIYSYVDLGLLGCLQAAKNFPLQFTDEHIETYRAKMARKRRKH